jgi:hypothetical protein
VPILNRGSSITRMKRYRSSQRGQSAIFATLSLVLSMGLIGMVVDVGWAYFTRIAAKTAAEAAASAATVAASSETGFTCGLNVPCFANDTACPATPTSPPSDIIQTGCLYAKQNGYVNSGRQTVVYRAATDSSPVTGVSPAYSVSFTVSESVPQLFSAVLGKQWATVSARATSGIFLMPQGACIYSLEPTGTDGVWGNGAMTVSSSCGIYVNSTNSIAMEAKGGAVFNASVIRIAGNYSTSGGGTISPAPSVNQTPVNDPLGYLPWPTPPDPTCDSTGITGAASLTVQSDGWYVICGDISLNGNQIQTYGAGKYYIKNGGISWLNGTASGNGVTFFLSSTGYEGVNVAGSMTTQLAAPSSGPYRGVLFFQDRAVPSTAADSQFLGGTSQTLNGSLYFSTTNIKYSGGNATSSNYTGLIGRTIEFKGNSYFTADTGGLYTGLGLPRLGLIE